MALRKDGNSNSSRNKQSTLSKFFETVSLILTWVCLGLFLEIQGPTFKDLQITTNGSTEEISRSISGRSVGYFVGAVIGGVLVDKLTRHYFLMIAICLDMAAITTAIVPWLSTPSLLWALFFLQGSWEGIINIAGQKLLLQIWKEKASSPLHALHLGYGIGSFIIPNIANPFLAVPFQYSDSRNGSMNCSRSVNGTGITTQLLTTESIEFISPKFVRESQVQWAYIIVSIITALNSLAFYVFQLKSSCSESPNHIEKVRAFEFSFKTMVKMVDPAVCAGGKRYVGVQLFLLLFMFLFNAFGVERICGKFIRNFAIDQDGFSNDDGSLINTSFWITFSVGRFCGFVGALLIPIRVLVIIEIFGTLISGILLNFLAYDNSLMLWIFTQPMAFFIAPLIPSGIAWANTYLELTGVAITFLLLGASLGGMSYMWIIGHFYDIDHRSLLYLSVTCGSVMTLLIIIMTVVTREGTRATTLYDDSVDVKLPENNGESKRCDRM